MSRLTPRDRLSHALAAAEDRGGRWPCKGRPEWISEDIDDRREAARLCTGCAVLALCHAAALDERPSWGVRASLDWGDREQRPKRTTQNVGAA